MVPGVFEPLKLTVILKLVCHILMSAALTMMILQGKVMGEKKNNYAEGEIGRSYKSTDRDGFYQHKLGTWVTETGTNE